MRNAINAWPEIIFTDSTYKMLANGMITVLTHIMHSNGRTHIGCVGLLTEESTELYQWVFRCLKSDNPKVKENNTCWMSDKCKMIRGALNLEFPGTPVYMCSFHSMQSFQREITTNKMQTTKHVVKEALKNLENMLYSDSEESYLRIYNKFKKEMPQNIINYVEKNWHNCRDEWTKYGMTAVNFGNITNNRAEGMHSMLKSEMGKNLSFLEFIQKLFKFLSSKYIADTHLKAKNCLARPARTSSKLEYQYREYLTETAANKVRVEIILQQKLKLLSKNTSKKECSFAFGNLKVCSTVVLCNCLEMKNWKLPCRHVFATRRIFRLPLFVPELCASRWTNKFYNEVFKNTSPKKTSTKELEFCEI